MRILVGCEFSGIVREAFAALGHDAWSCDILPTEIPGQHIQGDLTKILNWGWDLAIFHPPCTFLANSSNKHLYIGKKLENGPDPERWHNMREGAAFFNQLLNCDIPRICVENPIQHGHARLLIPKYTQVVQPWMFGHGETKATCLWMKGLPKLVPTEVVDGRVGRVHFESPGPDRWKNRSRTFTGLARAMAEQFTKWVEDGN